MIKNVIKRILDCGFLAFGLSLLGIIMIEFICDYGWWTLLIFPLYIMALSITLTLSLIIITILYLAFLYIIVNNNFNGFYENVISKIFPI